MKTKHFYLLLLLLLSAQVSFSQKKYTVSGYIKDANSGEDLLSASIYNNQSPPEGTLANAYGFYSLSLEAGQQVITYSYVGYNDIVVNMFLNKDTSINISLSDMILLDTTIIVTAERADKNVQSTQMGTLELSIETAKKLPALLGETDIIKTFQLLPGVKAAGEGNSGFYVRGGTADQNLVLLDEAVVYNTGHLLGFFSVFNSDAIKGATLIKGGMPANYGGRLSSVLDVQMKEGNNQHLIVEGGIGLVASRLTLQAPIVKNKGSFILSGRRTYVFDIAQPFIKNSKFAGTNYYFYDFNAKANYRISQRNRLFASGYFGRDVLKLNSPNGLDFSMDWGNATSTLRWNHLLTDKLFINTLLIFNKYNLDIVGGQSDFKFSWRSGIVDWGTKVAFDYYPNPNHSIKFGADYTFHTFSPSVAQAQTADQNFTIAPAKRYANESGIYFLDDWKITEKLSINGGLRISMFQQVGKYQSKLDTNIYYSWGQPVKTYYGIEPRISGKWSLDKVSSIKFAATLANQYVHLVSNSASTLPTDIWLPTSEIVKPQMGTQYAVGYFKNFKNNMYECSLEGYYKQLFNQLDYSENFTQSPDTDIEDQFIRGKGRAYGAELLIKKSKGKLTGWIGYTYSRSFRIFDGIQGTVFPSRFDRPNDISVVANYDINDRWNVGAVFIYGTGSPYTPIQSIYFINLKPVVAYGNRNSARLPDYHRLDLSATYRLNKDKNANFESSLVFSIYNIYNRKNVFATYTLPQSDANTGAISLKSYKVSLFPIIPSITWNFTWKQPKTK
jgi:TonB dependent receptor/TonB-dependent Receptor Plug Domain/CarboxypepD_reg-like domain